MPSGSDLSEALEEELDAVGEGLNLVGNIVLSAPLANADRALVETVAGHLREHVVLNLVVETSGEPVHEETRGNISGSVELEVHKVELAAIVGVIGIAGVMRSENNDCNEASSNGVRQEPPRSSNLDRGHSDRHEDKDEDVVQGEQGELERISATQSRRNVVLELANINHGLQQPDPTQ